MKACDWGIRLYCDGRAWKEFKCCKDKLRAEECVPATLNNMCAVHWGYAMRWGEGVFSAWRVSVHWGYTCNALGGFSSMHWRDIMIYVEGYHECIRGYPECTGDVQCIRGISSIHWRRVDIVYVMEHPQCTL